MGAAVDTDRPGVGEQTDSTEPGSARSARRFGTAWLALAVVVGLLLGYGAGLLAPKLTRPGDSSPEAGFARDMSTHHAQAVEMAMLAHEKASDPDVRVLAADIALTQQAQIGMMRSWLQDWHLDPTGSQPRMAWMPDGEAARLTDGLMPGMATDAERDQLRRATGHEFDVLFLRLMRTHHLGGIHMAEGVVKVSDDGQVRDLAEAMVTGQKKEIAGIDALLGKLGTA